jgi:hypothetical protein
MNRKQLTIFLVGISMIIAGSVLLALSIPTGGGALLMGGLVISGISFVASRCK